MFSGIWEVLIGSGGLGILLAQRLGFGWFFPRCCFPGLPIFVHGFLDFKNTQSLSYESPCHFISDESARSLDWVDSTQSFRLRLRATEVGLVGRAPGSADLRGHGTSKQLAALRVLEGPVALVLRQLSGSLEGHGYPAVWRREGSWFNKWSAIFGCRSGFRSFQTRCQLKLRVGKCQNNSHPFLKHLITPTTPKKNISKPL